MTISEQRDISDKGLKLSLMCSTGSLQQKDLILALLVGLIRPLNKRALRILKKALTKSHVAHEGILIDCLHRNEPMGSFVLKIIAAFLMQGQMKL